jgi:transcriptional regulator with XRE-family HTH domain
MTTSEAVARNLRRLMEAHRLTQVDVAKKAGVSQRHISNVLNLVNEPGIDRVDKIAKVFGLKGWQLQMPDIPDDMLLSSVVHKVFDALTQATPEGREMIGRLAEREAHYSKQKPKS